MTTKKLTQFSKSSGCGCKIEPKALSDLLASFKAGYRAPELLVGNENADDASVYDLGNDLLLLQTVDFFTPIVDDPYVFGQIAAANALSDIWAMGGKAITVHLILGWPMAELGPETAAQVMQGASDICDAHEVSMAGGHSIDIAVPVFGLTATGTIAKAYLKANDGAQAGDLLLMTKALGTGILSAALKKELIDEAGWEELKKYTTQTNHIGEKIAKIEGVHCITDVTGFGLVGHLLEVCKASDLLAQINWQHVNCMEASKPFAAQFLLPDNAFRNWNACEKYVVNEVEAAFPYLCDPQTNGPLLITASEGALPLLEAIMLADGVQYSIIGKMTARSTEDKYIHIQN